MTIRCISPWKQRSVISTLSVPLHVAVFPERKRKPGRLPAVVSPPRNREASGHFPLKGARPGAARHIPESKPGGKWSSILEGKCLQGKKGRFLYPKSLINTFVCCVRIFTVAYHWACKASSQHQYHFLRELAFQAGCRGFESRLPLFP